MQVRSLSRLRGRVGERVSPQWDNPQEERTLTRRSAPTSPASGRGVANSQPALTRADTMANATTASPAMMAASDSERIAPKRLFAFIIMVFGMFMSILDIQIV